MSPTPGPAIRATEGHFARADDSLALLAATCNIESAPRLTVRGAQTTQTFAVARQRYSPLSLIPRSAQTTQTLLPSSFLTWQITGLRQFGQRLEQNIPEIMHASDFLVVRVDEALDLSR